MTRDDLDRTLDDVMDEAGGEAYVVNAAATGGSGI